MTEKTLTTENIKPAIDALRGELAPWPVVAMKQDKLNNTQKSAVNSGITSGLVAQIIANTAAIRALESAITGTGLRPLVVASLPAIGTQGILYIVPVTTYDPTTDADVVNYSNEYIWIPVEAGTASEGHYEQVGQTGIVINNGQLNITVNGTSVGTFTANQSGDTTAAITVPTNADYVDKTTAQSIAGVKTFSDGIVSNVTGNVTGDLTGTASKAIADEDGTSIKTGYVNVAGNQTVSGDKSWTGSNAFNNILPNATNSYALGSSSYQWSSVYAQNYYYNGTAWGLDKANVWSKEQTILQSTIAQFKLKNSNIAIGNEVPSSQKTVGLLAFTGSDGVNMGFMDLRDSTLGNTFVRILARQKYDANGNRSTSGTLYESGLDICLLNNKTPCIVPTSNAMAHLGISTNKWKTLNGINPGALSLPGTTYTNIDTTGWSVTGAGNTYTPTLDGWVYVRITSGSGNYIAIKRGGSSAGYPCDTREGTALTYIALTVPVSRGQSIIIGINGTIEQCRFIPCQGNV